MTRYSWTIPSINFRFQYQPVEAQLNMHTIAKEGIKLKVVLVLVFLLALGQFRLFSSEVQIYNFRRGNGWLFLDRMNFEKGGVEASFKAKLVSQQIKENSQFFLELALVSEQSWGQQQLEKCIRQGISENRSPAKQVLMVVNLNSKNQYSSHVEAKFLLEQQKTYHFVMRDCQKSILKDQFSRESFISIELIVTNNGNNHSRTEQAYGVFLPILIVLTLGMLYYGRISEKVRRQTEQTETWTSYLLNICLWISLFSVVFKYLGYIIYVYFIGKDYAFFDFMYLILHSTSDSVACTMIILLAFGWTVTFNSSRDFDLYIPLVAMLGLIHVIMTMLNKITDGQHDKYHMYDSVPSYILLFFKFITISIFIFGIVKSFVALKKGQDKLRSYFLHIAISGFLYISVIPLGMYLITFVSASKRKEAILIGIQVAKNFINAYLIYMSNHRKSLYLSLAQCSFMEKDGKYL